MFPRYAHWWHLAILGLGCCDALGRSADDDSQHLSTGCLGGGVATRANQYRALLLIVLITSFVGWAGLARVIRGQVLSIKEREFVQAAQAMGGKPIYHHPPPLCRRRLPI